MPNALTLESMSPGLVKVVETCNHEPHRRKSRMRGIRSSGIWRGAGVGNLPAYSTTAFFCHHPSAPFRRTDRYFRSTSITRLPSRLRVILFDALPGAGPILAPRLLVAFGEQRERYGAAAAVQTSAGIAPVMERSGKQSWVHWRCQCPKFLRQTFARVGDSVDPIFLLGRESTMNNNATKGPPIKQQFGHWRSNGFGSCFDGGKTEYPTMRRPLWPRYSVAGITADPEHGEMVKKRENS